jgi:hypothetical protein
VHAASPVSRTIVSGAAADVDDGPTTVEAAAATAKATRMLTVT